MLLRIASRLWSSDSGQDLIEYALLSSLLVLGAVSAVRGFADAANGLWGFVRDTIVQYL